MLAGTERNQYWHILQIDDDEEDYILTREMLWQSSGHRIQLDWANSYENGENRLAEDYYSAVLVDYDLGGKTGIELIRENAFAYPAPMILFTGRGNHEVDLEAMQAGATLYLAKSEVTPLLLERGIRYAIDLKQKENELRHAKERLQLELAERRRFEAQLAFQASLLDNIHDAIIANDAEQRITAWNKAAEKLYGYTAEEALGQIHGDLLRSELSYAQRGSMLKQLEDQDEISIVVAQYTKDGRRLFVEGRTIPRRDENGDVTGYVTANCDITDREQAERAMQDSQAMLEAFFANSPNVVNILDESFRYIKTGSITPSFFGLDRQSIIGKSVQELAPQLIERYGTMMRRVIETGEPAQAEIPFPIPSRGGAISSWQASFFRVSLPGGKFGVGIMGVEKTAQKKAEHALHESEERLVKSFEASPNAMIISRLEDGRIENVNPAFEHLFGYPPEETIGRTSLELHLYAYPEDRQVLIQRLKKEGQVHDLELDIQKKSGEVCAASLSAATISVNGEQSLVAIIIDITGRKQAEEALQEKERLQRALADSLVEEHNRLKDILENLPVGVWIADETGRLIDKNEQADRIWAGSAPLLERVDQYQEYTAWFTDSGKKLAPEDYPVARALHTGQPVPPVEIKIRRFDGTEGIVLVSACPLTNRQGHLTGAVGINLDITNQKQVEDQARASEARLAEFLEGTDDAVFGLDYAWRFTYVNRHFYEMLGKQPEDLLGNVFQEALPEYVGSQLEQDYRKALEERVPVHCQVAGLYTAQWFDVSVYPTREGILIFAMDRTEQYEAQEALREREEMLQMALTAGQAGAWSWDLISGKMHWTNAFYRIFGYEPGSVAPSVEAGFQHVHPDDQAQAERVIQAAIEQGAPIDLPHRVIWQDGSIHWVRGMSNVSFDPEGKPTRLSGIVIDITHQKAIEERLASYNRDLERSNQALQDFASIAGHDLQEPLRKIVAFLRLLENRYSGQLGDEGKDYIVRITSAADRMSAMLNDLLSYARVTSQARTFSSVDLGKVVSEVMEDLETRIVQTNGKVEVGALPTIEADPMQLHQLFQNMISNGLKFHRPGIAPVVTITSKGLLDKRVEITIQDNGIGFDQSEVDRLFQPFTRLYGRSEFEGSGMGLAIVKKILDRHNGTIQVDSTIGEGTAFRIVLPIEQTKNRPGR